MCVFGLMTRLKDVDLGGGDAAAIGLLDGEGGFEVECFDGLMEDFGSDAGVDESPKEHIAANASEAVEIRDAHGGIVSWAKLMPPAELRFLWTERECGVEFARSFKSF